MSYSLIRGRRLRVTKLDGCGAPVLGPDSMIVTSGFITVALTANTNAGTAIQVENANGDRCVDETPVPKFVNYGAEYTFCNVDPELLHLLTGQPLVMDAAGTAIVGFRVDDEVDVETIGFASELWTGVGGSACDEEGDPLFGYSLLPFSKGGVVGNVSFENGNITFPVTGALTKKGSQWGAGPYDVVADEDGNPGPLNEAVVRSTHFHQEVTTVEPPDETDGASAVGVPATSAVAGTPGHYLPANSYGRASVAAMTGLTASPTTAWTTGQRVKNRDGSTAHWNATAWVAGPA